MIQEHEDIYEALQFNLRDRMRKALEVADLSKMEMAEYLDVTPQAISHWMSGRRAPSTQTLRLWAMRCQVPYSWLRNGETPGPDGSGGVGLLQLDSNQQPAGYGSVHYLPRAVAA